MLYDWELIKFTKKQRNKKRSVPPTKVRRISLSEVAFSNMDKIVKMAFDKMPFFDEFSKAKIISLHKLLRP